MGPQTAKHDVQISPEVVSILKSLGRNAILEFYTDIASRHSHTLDLRNFFLVWQQGETVQRKKTEERAKRHLVPTNGYKWRAAFSNKHQFSNYPPQIIIIMKVVSVLLKAYFLSASSSSCNSVVFSKLNFNHFQSFEIGRCSLCPHCRGFCQLQQPRSGWCQLLPRPLRYLQKSLWICLC